MSSDDRKEQKRTKIEKFSTTFCHPSDFSLREERKCNMKMAFLKTSLESRLNGRWGMFVVLKRAYNSYCFRDKLTKGQFMCDDVEKAQDKSNKLFRFSISFFLFLATFK